MHTSINVSLRLFLTPNWWTWLYISLGMVMLVCESFALAIVYMMEHVKPQHSFSRVRPVLVKGEEVCWALAGTLLDDAPKIQHKSNKTSHHSGCNQVSWYKYTIIIWLEWLVLQTVICSLPACGIAWWGKLLSAPDMKVKETKTL